MTNMRRMTNVMIALSEIERWKLMLWECNCLGVLSFFMFFTSGENTEGCSGAIVLLFTSKPGEGCESARAVAEGDGCWGWGGQGGPGQGGYGDGDGDDHHGDGDGNDLDDHDSDDDESGDKDDYEAAREVPRRF